MGKAIVVQADAQLHAELETQGWRVTARSFGAQLDADRIDRPRLCQLVTRIAGIGSVRELGAGDVDAVLKLDRATVRDYPGSVATRHTRLDGITATPSAARRAFGVITLTGDLAAMTFIEVDGTNAETDFTVAQRVWRGRGFGSAVKAASILALASDGIQRFRTGGSVDNRAILSANDAVGYIRDEEWVTLEQSAP
jgi:hypothetical protein